MGATLFIFEQLTPTKNIPLTQIQSVSKVGDRVYFNIIEEGGNKRTLEHKLTPFIEQQIIEYGIEVYS